MRLSTSTIFDMSMRSVLQQQSHLAHVRQQLASGERILTPADDPRAAAQALVVSQSLAVNGQFAANRATARNQLAAEAVELESVTHALQAAKPLLVQAASGALNGADLHAIAAELKGVYTQLLSSANARDGNGNYLFSGFKVHGKAFTGTMGSVSYSGGTRVQQLQVDGSRLMSINDTGKAVFASVTDSASYVASAGGGNTGTAVFSGIHVTDPALAAAGDDYRLTFTSISAAGSEPTTYTVGYQIDNVTTGTSTTVTQSYDIPGAALTIAIGGVSVDFEGVPDAGDSFYIAQDRPADNNILNTLAGIIEQLKAGVATPQRQAALRNALNSAQQKLGNALDNVLTIRASVGSRLQELDALDDIGASRKLNYQRTLSGLRDLDYARAASEYAMARVALQMSQKTFLDIQKLSIFKLV